MKHREVDEVAGDILEHVPGSAADVAQRAQRPVQGPAPSGPVAQHEGVAEVDVEASASRRR
eukprot:1162532-Heterocapsa_arctica.AAC.1